ncbi:MAG: transcription elongation factor GreB [Gammaproteobacteria bacterium]
MSKAFTRESDDESDDSEQPETRAVYKKNYMTPQGHAALSKELLYLLREERPKVVETVSWAAKNGDRSENGDYIYGKRRLREIDRRIRYLTKQLDNAEVVDPKQQQHLKQVFFGATVTYRQKSGAEKTVKIVGIDEADFEKHKISWISPLAKALLKSSPGDIIQFRTPTGSEAVEILAVKYLL